MPKERKPGWVYCKSDILGEEFAIHESTGWVYFEKGARYSPKEIAVLSNAGAKLDMATHNVKTIIKGEIVKHGELEKPEKKIEASTVQGELDIW